MEGRKVLIHKLLSKTCHSLKDLEIEAIAKEVEGFSGADIDILVREAAFEPLRIGIRATHFKNENGKMIPCSPSDPHGQKIRLADISPDDLELPCVEMDHFLMALTSCKASVDAKDLLQYEQWTEQFGYGY
jgi:vacuolar protein-sorting-associated protein 4